MPLDLAQGGLEQEWLKVGPAAPPYRTGESTSRWWGGGRGHSKAAGHPTLPDGAWLGAAAAAQIDFLLGLAAEALADDDFSRARCSLPSSAPSPPTAAAPCWPQPFAIFTAPVFPTRLSDRG